MTSVPSSVANHMCQSIFSVKLEGFDKNFHFTLGGKRDMKMLILPSHSLVDEFELSSP